MAPVCQEGDQLELMCNTTAGLDHQWLFTIFPENISYTRAPVSSIGIRGTPQALTISSSMITFSRLSDQNVLPLISRVTISPVTSDLNGIVVNCFELATNLVATTTIQLQIIDSQEFGKTPQPNERTGLCVIHACCISMTVTVFPWHMRHAIII